MEDRTTNEASKETTLRDRWVNSILAVLCIGWGLYGRMSGDLALPSKRGVIHFHGNAGLLMFFSLLSFGVSFLMPVVWHYDNDDVYLHIDKVSTIAGWFFFVIAGVVWIGS